MLHHERRGEGEGGVTIFVQQKTRVMEYKHISNACKIHYQGVNIAWSSSRHCQTSPDCPPPGHTYYLGEGGGREGGNIKSKFIIDFCRNQHVYGTDHTPQSTGVDQISDVDFIQIKFNALIEFFFRL